MVATSVAQALSRLATSCTFCSACCAGMRQVAIAGPSATRNVRCLSLTCGLNGDTQVGAADGRSVDAARQGGVHKRRALAARPFSCRKRLAFHGFQACMSFETRHCLRAAAPAMLGGELMYEWPQNLSETAANAGSNRDSSGALMPVP
jgi:hypothetical protein